MTWVVYREVVSPQIREKRIPPKPSFNSHFGKFCATLSDLLNNRDNREKNTEQLFYKEQAQKIESIKKIFEQAIATINTVDIDLLVLEFNNLQIRLRNLQDYYNKNRENTEQEYSGEKAIVDYYKSRTLFFEEKPSAPPSIKIPRNEIINEYLILARTILNSSGQQTDDHTTTNEVKETILKQLKKIRTFFEENAPNPVFLSKINL